MCLNPLVLVVGPAPRQVLRLLGSAAPKLPKPLQPLQTSVGDVFVSGSVTGRDYRTANRCWPFSLVVNLTTTIFIAHAAWLG